MTSGHATARARFCRSGTSGPQHPIQVRSARSATRPTPVSAGAAGRRARPAPAAPGHCSRALGRRRPPRGGPAPKRDRRSVSVRSAHGRLTLWNLPTRSVPERHGDGHTCHCAEDKHGDPSELAVGAACLAPQDAGHGLAVAVVEGRQDEHEQRRDRHEDRGAREGHDGTPSWAAEDPTSTVHTAMASNTNGTTRLMFPCGCASMAATHRPTDTTTPPPSTIARGRSTAAIFAQAQNCRMWRVQSPSTRLSSFSTARSSAHAGASRRSWATSSARSSRTSSGGGPAAGSSDRASLIDLRRRSAEAEEGRGCRALTSYAPRGGSVQVAPRPGR